MKDEEEYRREWCRREKKRLRENPPKTKIEYWFTRAYGMPEVCDKAYVDANPEPVQGFRPNYDDPKELWDAYMDGKEANYQWGRFGGCIRLYCPAITKTNGAERTAFLDLSHVHNGFYDRPMLHFTTENYPRCNGDDHCIVLDDAHSGGTALNITKDWDSFTVEDQIAVTKHIKAIELAAYKPHSNRPDSIAVMVHDVRVITTPEDDVSH